MNNKPEELKACPWCGIEDDLDVVDDYDLIPDCQWFVWCMNCAVAGPHVGSKEAAIKAWNQREGEK